MRSHMRAGGGSGKLNLVSLAVFALAPHSAVGADGGAPAVLALAPHSVMLADASALAVFAPAPLAVMLTFAASQDTLFK